MKKILICNFFLLFTALSFSIFIYDYPKKIISRLIFSHDLSLLTHVVFNNIDKNVEFEMKKKENQKNSLIVLNNFVYNFFRPVFKNLDDGVSWKMLHGSIWCDGVADIFLRLAENTNTRVVMIFLFNNDGVSPHTLNFADLNNNIKYFENSSNLNKMYLFDPQNNYFPINKNNKFINIDYMLKNINEFSNYNRLDSDNIKLNLLQNKKKVFITNRTYNEYSSINKLSRNLVNCLPNYFFKYLFKLGIYVNPELDEDYKEFLCARLEHILLNYNDALLSYSGISDKSKYYDNAQYWYKSLKSSQSILKKYEDILSPLTNSPLPQNL
tara:strand:+ start:123 stop:1097 length:975 start_codon:yes stop_codon:yes gene_type:complete